MSKGNLGLGLGVASLILSGCMLTYGYNQTEDKIEAMQEKTNELIEIADSYKVKVSELEYSLKSYEDLDKENKEEIKKLIEDEARLKKEFEEEKKKLKAKQEEMSKKAEEAKKELSSKISYSDEADWVTYTQTHYTSYCNTGCIGKTATGMNVKSSITHEGMSIIAVDPTRIPLGSIVEIYDGTKTFKAIAGDTGGAIKGNKIDLLVSVKDSNYAYSLGVKKVKIKIIRKGWAKA